MTADDLDNSLFTMALESIIRQEKEERELARSGACPRGALWRAGEAQLVGDVLSGTIAASAANR